MQRTHQFRQDVKAAARAQVSGYGMLGGDTSKIIKKNRQLIASLVDNKRFTYKVRYFHKVNIILIGYSESS